MMKMKEKVKVKEIVNEKVKVKEKKVKVKKETVMSWWTCLVGVEVEGQLYQRLDFLVRLLFLYLLLEYQPFHHSILP
jgi:hypothetical protein